MDAVIPLEAGLDGPNVGSYSSGHLPMWRYKVKLVDTLLVAIHSSFSVLQGYMHVAKLLWNHNL